MRRWAVVGCVLVSACMADERVSVGSLPIVGGVREPGEDAVVVVKAYAGIGLCTGTLISDRVVLTAKHCVQGPTQERPFAPSTLTVGFGSQATTSRDVRVERIDTTPGVYFSDPRTGIGGALVGIDVAAVTLRNPVVDVTPIPVGRDDAELLTGMTFTAIGFGQTEAGSSGVKYRGDGVIDRVSEGVIFTALTICQGDSGGPMIIEEPERRVVGVASFGQAGECPSAQDGYNRIDRFLGLIDGAIIRSGACPVVSDEECNGIDDDCDGVIDEGCASLGEPCDADADCAHAQLPARFAPVERPVFCGDTPAGRMCTRTCDPMRPRESCATLEVPFSDDLLAIDGLYCSRSSGCEGTCVPGAPGDGLDQAACATDRDCASLACLDPGDGRARCLTPCTAGLAYCPADQVCGANPGTCSGCLPPDVVQGLRALGEPCEMDGDCAGGPCAFEGVVPYCSAPCADDDGCPAGFHCRDDLCLRGERSRSGDACLVDGDCIDGDVCMFEGDGPGFCSHACTTDGSCPDGFDCTDLFCRPGAGTVRLGDRCSSDEDCVAGASCVDVGAGSICTRTCGVSGGCPGGLACRRVGRGPDLYCAGEVAPRSPGGGGCDCRVTRPAGPAPWPLLALLVLAIGAWRRRAVRRSEREEPRGGPRGSIPF